MDSPYSHQRVVTNKNDRKVGRKLNFPWFLLCFFFIWCQQVLINHQILRMSRKAKSDPEKSCTVVAWTRCRRCSNRLPWSYSTFHPLGLWVWPLARCHLQKISLPVTTSGVCNTLQDENKGSRLQAAPLLVCWYTFKGVRRVEERKEATLLQLLQISSKWGFAPKPKVNIHAGRGCRGVL